MVRPNGQFLDPALVLVGDPERDPDHFVGCGRHQEQRGVEVGSVGDGRLPVDVWGWDPRRPFVEGVLDDAIRGVLLVIGAEGADFDPGRQRGMGDDDVVG